MQAVCKGALHAIQRSRIPAASIDCRSLTGHVDKRSLNPCRTAACKLWGGVLHSLAAWDKFVNSRLIPGSNLRRALKISFHIKQMLCTGKGVHGYPHAGRMPGPFGPKIYPQNGASGCSHLVWKRWRAGAVLWDQNLRGRGGEKRFSMRFQFLATADHGRCATCLLKRQSGANVTTR